MRYQVTGAAVLAAAALIPLRAQAADDPEAPAVSPFATVPVTGPATSADGPADDRPLPRDLQKLLDAAIAGGNEKDIDTIARYLVKVAPESAATVSVAVAEHRKRATEAHREKLLAERFFDGWKGEGQFGASQSSGNSSTLNLSLGLDLEKDGLHWRHKFRARADYQRSNGVTSANQITASYEPNYKFDGNMFVFGLAQFERDPFQGFEERYSLSGGLGYRAIDSHGMSLDIKAGPAWRETDYVNDPSDAQLTLLAAAHYRWKLSRGLTFRQSIDSVLASGDKTLTSLTSLDSRISHAFSTRLSYEVDYESDPPPGTRKLDTLSRITLVYGF